MSRPIHEMESRWQKRWEEEGVYRAEGPGERGLSTPSDSGRDDKRAGMEKFYGLIEFPYPSGDGLHVGHPRSYTAIDIVTRKKRMEGRNVLYPIGWDAFGLPTENYAIKNKVKPADATKKNVGNFTRQIKSLGFGFDWSREVDTTDPAYYKWTQWQFLQFFKHGMAYKAASTINWCPKDKIGLANEEAQGGVCERCGTAVEKREKEQWMIRITDYAQRLLTDLDTVDYLEKIKSQQVNWIGKSEGAEIAFRVSTIERVMVATSNKSKVARVKKLLSATLPYLQVVTPMDLGIVEEEVEEGDDLFANAAMKAAAYAGQTELPILGMDTGLFIEGEWLNPATPKRNALGERDESTMTQEEKAAAMDAFYRELADRRGGEVEAYWKDALVLRLPSGKEVRGEAIRPIILTSKRKGEIDPYFPVRGLYKVKANGKYVVEQTEEEELNQELAPLKVTLLNLFSDEVRVFTTRPDTVFGVTYVVLAPEHPLVAKYAGSDEVLSYVKAVAAKSDEERTGEDKEKTGVRLPSVFALNPVNGERVPVWIADYVLPNYGTGAVMAVPAHDERDYVFAKKYGLPIRMVVEAPKVVERSPVEASATSAGAYGHGSTDIVHECWTEAGHAINSGFLDGAPTWKAKEDMMSWLEEHGCGKKKVTYRLRDWVFSRQRYWGEPIPLVHCGTCAKRKQKALLIHGFGGSGEGNWFPWMKAQLEKEGFEVFTPSLSTSDHPSVDGWMSELKSFVDQLGEMDVVVGHSLGSKAALHLIERAGKKIGALFLVASAIGSLEQRNWDDFRSKWPDADIDALKKFWDERFSWEKVSGLVESKHVIISDDDQLIPLSTHRGIPEGWMRHVWTGYRHFQVAEQPELLKLILTSKNTGWVALPDSQLPLTLPEVDVYEPTDTGESPLAKIESWVKTTCPRCGGEARRETDTMPNWAGSSWYFLRYCDPKNTEALASKEALKYWMPVDLYNGGMEHTTLHLLYSRFWYKFLWDLGVVPEECGSEPYKMRRSHNMILGEGGVKMSKSKGNVVNPDDVVEKYGSDVFRVYEMFIGPYDQPAPWDTNGIEGVRRFLDKVWGLFEGREVTSSPQVTSDLETLYHQTLKKVTEGIDNLQFNTCISQLMILTNAMQDAGGVPETMVEGYLKMLAPFAPHLADEIWCEVLGHKTLINARGAGWPAFDGSKLQAATFELVVQVNGKVRDKITVASDIGEEEAKATVLGSEKVQKWLEGKTPKQVVYVKGRLVSVVV